MKPLHAFSGYGIGLEYMIVDRNTLSVHPMADVLLRDGWGSPISELSRDRLCWANGLPLHVIEIKNLAPEADLAALVPDFQAEVRELNHRLASHEAQLMPTGMHPWMDPARETHLWPHGGGEAYRAYDRVFGCHHLGFANSPGMHLGMGFADDREFARLHAAIRLVLPLLPALAASSPLAWGGPTGFLDTRLEAWLTRQAQVPETMGLVIPETVSSPGEYRDLILEPMYRAIFPLDPAGVLGHEWLNARGVVPRFERMALEIRLMGMQEYPGADLAVAAAVAAAVERLYRAGEDPAMFKAQQDYPTESLAELLRAGAHDADQLPLRDQAYLTLLDLPPSTCNAGEAWRHLIEAWWEARPDQRQAWGKPLDVILEHGPLARRIQRAVGESCPRSLQETVYWSLCECLDKGYPFVW